MFTGDTLFSEGCGLCLCKGGSAEKMYDSIQKIKNMVSDDVLIYPGHSYGVKPGKAFGHLRMINVYLGIEDKKKFVDFRNRRNLRGMFNFK
jgi:glyoxylase-like metal-dependent hydrolase (beta-lactamase superfamily II)